jgi:hypothetical protein
MPLAFGGLSHLGPIPDEMTPIRAGSGWARRFAIFLAMVLGLGMVSCTRPPALPRTPTSTPEVEISVTAYGAVADGIMDARPGIQAALDSAHEAHVGVYFPAGTYLLKSATQPGDRILRTYPDQRLRGSARSGTILRVGNGFGPYRTVIGLATDALSAGSWSLSHLGIDQNDQNSNMLNPGTALNFPLMAIRIGSYDAGSKVTVTHCVLSNSSSLNGLYLYAAYVEVSQCAFMNIGGQPGSPVHDHSTVYTSTVVDGGRQVIEDNTFQGVSGSGGAWSAIDTHGGTQLVRRNSVRDYLRGFNITDMAPVSTTTSLVEANTIRGVLIGIEVWTRPRIRSVPADVTIRRNLIQIVPVAWRLRKVSAPAAGITINRAASGALSSMSLVSNTISYVVKGNSEGIRGAAIDCSTASRTLRIKRLSITGNRIVAAPGEAISYSCAAMGGHIVANRVQPQ